MHFITIVTTSAPPEPITEWKPDFVSPTYSPISSPTWQPIWQPLWEPSWVSTWNDLPTHERLNAYYPSPYCLIIPETDESVSDPGDGKCTYVENLLFSAEVERIPAIDFRLSAGAYIQALKLTMATVLGVHPSSFTNFRLVQMSEERDVVRVQMKFRISSIRRRIAASDLGAVAALTATEAVPASKGSYINESPLSLSLFYVSESISQQHFWEHFLNAARMFGREVPPEAQVLVDTIQIQYVIPER